MTSAYQSASNYNETQAFRFIQKWIADNPQHEAIFSKNMRRIVSNIQLRAKAHGNKANFGEVQAAFIIMKLLEKGYLPFR
jgi:phage-related protein